MPWWKKTLAGIGGAFVLLIVAGFSYQKMAASQDAALRPPASEMIDVNGHMVHLVCMGAGPRTFLLEAGHGDFSIAWHLMQPQLAKAGRACAYDRAGLGWSDWVDGGYDGIASADQLAALVKAAKIQTPLVYVGHSYGANLALIFASRYPQAVGGLVLLDPADPRQMHFGVPRAEAMTATECGAKCYLVVAAAHLGVTRLLTSHIGGPDLAKPIADQLHAGMARPATAYAAMASWGAFPKTGYETDDARLGAMPLLVVLSASQGHAQQDLCRGACIAKIAATSMRATGPVFIADSTHGSLVIGKQEAAVAAKIIAFARGLPGS